MRLLKYVLPLCFLSPGGCAYIEAQSQLTQQVRKGIALVATAQAEHGALIDKLDKLQRQKMDDAFDADVRQQQTLSPDWVIEHRRAYAAALDVLARWRSAASAANQSAAANLKSIDAALQRLQWLQSVEMSWINP